MTSGPRANLLATLAGVALALSGSCAHAGTRPAFERLMGLLAARQRGSVTFTARTYAAGLTRPLQSAGILRYRAPDHLEQLTREPARSALILDGERLTVRRDGRTRHLNLRDYPDIAVYVAALRDTLGGRGAQLQRHFAIGWHGTLAHWQLTLRPLQHRARVRRIRLTGAAADIHSIEILAADGARTVMRLGPTPAA